MSLSLCRSFVRPLVRPRFESSTGDWFVSAETFRDLLMPFVNPNDRVLHLGCGISMLPAVLASSGFTNANLNHCVYISPPHWI